MIKVNLQMRIFKHMTVLAAFFALLGLVGCDKDEVRISYGKLPSAARVFIEAYFPNETCNYAEQEKDDGRKEYKAVLSNGTEIVFDASGQWTEVDCKFSLLPAGIVPQRIVEDVSVRYPGAGMYKVERAMGGYEISIGSGLELIYSADGTFIREEHW